MEQTGQTRLAFEFSQQGAYTNVVSFNGNPPEELFLCQLCYDYVTSDYLDLKTHIHKKHNNVPQNDVETVLNLFK